MDNIILPAPQAAFGLAAVIFLALYVFKIYIPGLNRVVLAAAALISVFAAAFTYFYSADYEVFLNGFIARRAGLLVFCSAAFMVLFSLRRKKYGDYYFLSVSSVMLIFALTVYYSGIPLQAAGVFAVDIFVMLFKKKETEAGESLYEEALANKLLHFIPAAAFMFLFLSGPQDLKLQKLAFNGMVFMLILSTTGSFFTVTAHEMPRLKQHFMAAGPVAGFIAVLAQFVIICSLIRQNQGLLLGSFLSIVILLLLLGAAFKSVTEEKYQFFVLRDIYILFFLGLFGTVSASLSPFNIAVYSVLFVLQAIFAMEALAGPNSAKQTMTGVKYSFEKIQDNHNIFISACAGLCAETYMAVSIYKNMAGNPLIHAVILIGAAFYSSAFLNKVFTLFSMARRIKVDYKFKTVFNKNALIMLLFLGMAAAMLCKW